MKILVLDRASLGADLPLDLLSHLGDVEIYDSTSREELRQRCTQAEVLILNKVKIDEDILSIAKKLRLICITATGYDNVDIEAARAHGVAVCNVPAYSTESVTLFTLATVLALQTHIREYNRFVVDGSYTESGIPNRLSPVYHEICGLTWGIIGYGNIGKSVARVAEALGARVIVNKRTPLEGTECVDIDTLCKRSDIITIHCPLNSDTANLINKKRIDMMKDGVIIVNEARGAVVNDPDIVEAVLAGKIGGFGSDVYNLEPISDTHPFNAIKHLENVLLTPHAAWGAYESRKRCISIVADNIRAFISKEIQNRVDI